jgi:arginine utilization regulatory protein
MEVLKRIFKGKGYIDGITIINSAGEILFTAKLNEKLSGYMASENLVGKNFFEVYENMNEETSTIVKAMELGMPVYVENQELKPIGKRGIRITSLSLPIKNGDRIVGAIDLSTQEQENGNEFVTTGEKEQLDNTESIDLETVNFPLNGTLKMPATSMATFDTDDIIAVDEKMKQAKAYIKVVSACKLPVLIYGETGTGKEVFAQAIHNASDCKEKPFIAQNCAAIPDALLESILFGTSRGAFTGAIEKKGLFDLADGGTLFLDEINSMPTNLQSKLLRVLQDGYFRSLGSKDIKKVNVKIIAATNVLPEKAIAEGKLRKDIYYRLSMMSITIPPLRERRKDIIYFVKHYVAKYNKVFNKKVEFISKELMLKMENYDWPGNVRELEHVIVYGMSMIDSNSNMLRYSNVKDKFTEMKKMNDEAIKVHGVPKDQEEIEKKVYKPIATQASPISTETTASLTASVDDYEKEIIAKTCLSTKGNVSKAAKLLDIPRQTLQRKIKKYHIKID